MTRLKWPALAFVLFAVAFAPRAQSQQGFSDVTVIVAGDLLAKGGTVLVYPLPVPDGVWQAAVSRRADARLEPDGLPPLAEGGERMIVRLERQFGELQFLHPEGSGRYAFRFRAAEGAANGEELQTRLLSIGGIDSATGHGDIMQRGFTGRATSGLQLIHVIADGTDERAARVLAGLAGQERLQPEACDVQALTALCTFPPHVWPAVERDWQAGKLALDKEYRRMESLDTCYRQAESAGKTGGTCHLLSKEDEEAVYEYR